MNEHISDFIRVKDVELFMSYNTIAALALIVDQVSSVSSKLDSIESTIKTLEERKLSISVHDSESEREYSSVLDNITSLNIEKESLKQDLVNLNLKGFTPVGLYKLLVKGFFELATESKALIEEKDFKEVKESLRKIENTITTREGLELAKWIEQHLEFFFQSSGEPMPFLLSHLKN